MTCFRLALCLVQGFLLFGAALKTSVREAPTNLTVPVRENNGIAAVATDVVANATKLRFYFFLQEYTDPKSAHYQHMPIALGEGLSEAGYAIRANVDYWRKSRDSEDYLFKKTNESPTAFDAIVVPHPLANSLPRALLQTFNSSKRPKMVMLDWSDNHRAMTGTHPEAFYDIYYRSDYTTAVMPEEPRKPLTVSALYLTNRILEAADASLQRARDDHVQRNRTYLWPHVGTTPVSKTMLDQFIIHMPAEHVRTYEPPPEKYEAEADYLYWTQTGHRHDDHFYDVSSHCKIVDCSAGNWMKNFKITQWETLQFWEALASGTAVMMPDLERYGGRLPVMPEPFVHYIPVFFNKNALISLHENVTQGKLDVGAIGRAGREWARLHYSPRAFAQRFIKDVFPDYARHLYR